MPKKIDPLNKKLYGAVGAALCARFLDLQWVERRPHTRALAITRDGQTEGRLITG